MIDKIIQDLILQRDAEEVTIKFDTEEAIKEHKEQCDFLIELLEKEKTNGWISCSERLPSKEEFLKDDGRFIVTDGNRRYESCYDIYTHCFKTLKLFNFNSAGRNSRFEYDRCVIAWQPLPTPYKEGEN